MCLSPHTTQIAFSECRYAQTPNLVPFQIRTINKSNYKGLTAPEVRAPAQAEEDLARAVVPLAGDPKRRKLTEQNRDRSRMAKTWIAALFASHLNVMNDGQGGHLLDQPKGPRVPRTAGPFFRRSSHRGGTACLTHDVHSAKNQPVDFII